MNCPLEICTMARQLASPSENRWNEQYFAYKILLTRVQSSISSNSCCARIGLET